MKTKQTDPSQATLGNASPLPPDDDRPPLPEGWVWTTIGKVTQSIGKIQPKETPEWQFTYLDISSIDNQTYRIAEPKTYYGSDAPSRAPQPDKAGDVLFSTVRTYLKNIALVPDIYDGQIASTGFSVLRSQSVILPKYLFYYSLTDDFLNALSKLQRGTSYPAVRDGDVRAQSIPLPEQHRIVAAIETQFTRLDAAVAALHRVKANLARYKASVLKAACEGRLVPTDAALYRAACRGEAAPQASISAETRGDAEAPGREEPGGGCLAPTDATPPMPTATRVPAMDTSGIEDACIDDAWMHDARRGEATPQASISAETRGDAEAPGREEPGGGCLAPAMALHIGGKGEATPQSPMTATGHRDAETPGAPSTASHIDGKGEATPQSPMTAMGHRDAETPGQAEPGGGCLAPTDAGAAAYEPADVLLRRILTERRARWMADNPGKRYTEPQGPDTSGPALSAAEGLPDLPEGWVWASLPQLGELARGKSKHRPRNAPHLYGGPYPFNQTGEIRQAQGVINDYSQTYSEAGLAQSRLWPKGTLCITIAANIAETAILGFDACFPDSVVGFVAEQDVNVRFVEYYIRTIREDLERYAPATAQKNINLETLQNVGVALPSFAEQHRIVAEVERRLSVVAEVEAAVDANLARAARLRRAILREAFAGRLVPRGGIGTRAGLRRGEATLHASTYAKMRGDAEAPGREEPGGGCLAPAMALHIGGK